MQGYMRERALKKRGKIHPVGRGEMDDFLLTTRLYIFWGVKYEKTGRCATAHINGRCTDTFYAIVLST